MDAKWLVDQLDKSERSQADLARYLDLHPTVVNKMVKGRRKILSTEADAIRRFFSIPPDGAAQKISNTARSLVDANVVPPLRSQMPRDIPIFGTVSGGAGALQMNGDPIDWVRRPPRLDGRPDVFGLYVEDLSMVPAYRPGALILVERARPPSPGDDVVIELRPSNPREDQRAIIKRLVALTPTIVRLEQFNPAKELEFPRKQIIHMYRVMTLAELLGV